MTEKGQRKVESRAAIPNPTPKTNTVGGWGGPRDHVVGPNHLKKWAIRTALGQREALVWPSPRVLLRWTYLFSNFYNHAGVLRINGVEYNS